MALIPHISDYHPEVAYAASHMFLPEVTAKWMMMEKKLVRVPVERIVGVANPRVSSYYSNWNPTPLAMNSGFRMMEQDVVR